MLERHEATAVWQVMVVDDSPEEREAVRKAVERAGPPCRCVFVDSLKEALEIVWEQPRLFNLLLVNEKLLLDANGEIDTDAITRLRLGSGARMAVYAGRPTVPMASQVYEAGADTYLPRLRTSRKQFQEKIRKLLGRRNEYEVYERQCNAQRIADEDLDAHRAEWIRKYGGKMVLYDSRTRRVIAKAIGPMEIGEKARQYDDDARLDMAILLVPREEERHGAR